MCQSERAPERPDGDVTTAAGESTLTLSMDLAGPDVLRKWVADFATAYPTIMALRYRGPVPAQDAPLDTLGEAGAGRKCDSAFGIASVV